MRQKTAEQTENHRQLLLEFSYEVHALSLDA